MIKFNQNAWLKLLVDMNTNLRKKAKGDFEKRIFFFFQLMHNAAGFGKLWKMWENIEILGLS